MTSRIGLAGLVAALAAAVALAGCGGTSKADFVKEADALCVKTNKEHPPKTASNPKQAAALWAEELTIRRQLDSDLRKLDVPDDVKKDFDAYNAGTTRIIAVIGSLKTSSQKKDATQYKIDQRAFETAAASREKVAQKIGFKTCGRSRPK